MSNPYFDRSPAFQQGKPGSTATISRTPNGYPTMPGYEPGGTYKPGAQAGSQAAYTTQQAPGYGTQVSPEQLARMEQTYAAPSASNVDRGMMTYDDVIMRTGLIFLVLLGVGAVSWILATNVATAGTGMAMMGVGAIASLVLGLINSFKREPSPLLILAYGAAEGAMLGGFSGVMEMAYPGIVLQAVMGTVATFAVVLVAYKFGGFRVSGKAAKILLIAMFGYLAFSLVNLVLMWTGLVNDPWGARGIMIAGIPLGVIIGLLAVVMAAFSLAMDFEFIQNGVENGLPTRYAWAAAFGLVVTLVWLYVEIIRIIAIIRDLTD